MASVYAHAVSTHLVLCTEVAPVYNICTTTFGMCCSQSCAPKCSHNGLLAKCCGGQEVGLMKTETVDQSNLQMFACALHCLPSAQSLWKWHCNSCSLMLYFRTDFQGALWNTDVYLHKVWLCANVHTYIGTYIVLYMYRLVLSAGIQATLSYIVIYTTDASTGVYSLASNHIVYCDFILLPVYNYPLSASTLCVCMTCTFATCLEILPPQYTFVCQT